MQQSALESGADRGDGDGFGDGVGARARRSRDASSPLASILMRAGLVASLSAIAGVVTQAIPQAAGGTQLVAARVASRGARPVTRDARVPGSGSVSDAFTTAAGSLFVSGTVTAVSDRSITISLPSGKPTIGSSGGSTAPSGSLTAAITSATTFPGAAASIVDVKVGDMVALEVAASLNGGTTSYTALEVTDPASALGGRPSGPPQATSPGAPSMASGSPADAASLASKVDPGLVDIETTMPYVRAKGLATGMMLSSSGLVLTNNHVVEGATSIEVRDVATGHTYPAVVLGYDRAKDVALLRLKGARGLKTVSLRHSSATTVGTGVVCVGNAGGKGGTPSYAGGEVTALDQAVTARDALGGATEHLSGLIETNADILSGDSGGPMVDDTGQVIGMDTASSSGYNLAGAESKGYAIPIGTAEKVVSAIEHGRHQGDLHLGSTAFLGVEVTPVSGTRGAKVTEVLPGKAAARAGLSAGDVIVSLSGHHITSPGSLTKVMLVERPGTSVRLAYLDPSGTRHEVTVDLTSGPAL